jgi:hypothetical protein
MANSDNQYQENLDILQTMIDKYVDSHTIIIKSFMKRQSIVCDIPFEV